jgi:hypothetical protein
MVAILSRIIYIVCNLRTNRGSRRCGDESVLAGGEYRQETTNSAKAPI